MTTERKLFTAELKLLRQKGGALPAGPGAGGTNAEVLQALVDLKADLKGLEALIKGEDAPTPTSIQAETQQKQAEVAMLRTELRALAVCIEQTKSEIAQLRPKDAEDDHLIAVTFELDAIVTATERATQQILEAAEKIETLAREIVSHSSDSYVARLVEDIGETIVSMYEACNFQDITGQRITKVVRTLKYIEARVNAMIEIWGAENIAEATPVLVEDHRDEEAKLLNGPQLESKAISQDEIDKLFG
ncbi:MAG: protein phosphatase CheZ [Actinomycetota bacterium]